jgi:radical SAM protein with 4Fe4S-binding SPASM domain
MFEHLSAPIKVSFDVTHQCNLHCRHCRIKENMDLSLELSFSEIKNLIDELSAMKVFILGFSGGEPFTRKDFTDIAVYAARSGIARIFISTNCSLINGDIISRLNDHRDKFVFKASIDGVGETHDKIRGQRGAFIKTNEAISLLRGVGFSVQVTTTLMKSNFRQFIQIIEFVKNLNVQKHRIIDIMPLGRANEDLVLSDQQRRICWSIFTQNKDNLTRPNCEVTLEMPFMEPLAGQFTCRAGRSECGIFPDGTVVGCRLLPDIIAGNIRDKSFRQIWNDAEAFGVFRKVTPDNIKGNCSSCEYGILCRGGCRAYAMAVNGDFYMPDPRCSLASGAVSL